MHSVVMPPGLTDDTIGSRSFTLIYDIQTALNPDDVDLKPVKGFYEIMPPLWVEKDVFEDDVVARARQLGQRSMHPAHQLMT